MSEFADIRLAEPTDYEPAYEARQRSIRELSSAYYTTQQIEAWLDHGYEPNKLVEFFSDGLVWVIEEQNQIEGVAYLKKDGEVKLLYLTKKVSGCGLGKKLMAMMEAQARQWKLPKLRLRSSLNAHKFYLAQGFVNTGPIKEVLINNCGIPCIEMEKSLGTDPWCQTSLGN